MPAILFPLSGLGNRVDAFTWHDVHVIRIWAISDNQKAYCLYVLSITVIETFDLLQVDSCFHLKIKLYTYPFSEEQKADNMRVVKNSLSIARIFQQSWQATFDLSE